MFDVFNSSMRCSEANVLSPGGGAELCTIGRGEGVLQEASRTPRGSKCWALKSSALKPSHKYAGSLFGSLSLAKGTYHPVTGMTSCLRVHQ